MPPSVEDCLLALGPLTNENAAGQQACERLEGGDQNYRNSMLALDLNTLAIKWAVKLGGPDAWNAASFGASNPNYPRVAGPDYDFGQAPMIVTACRSGQGCKQLAVAAAKSGIAFALNLDDGTLAWSRQVGPAGTIGGAMWGSASDNKRVYVSINNFFHTPLGDYTPASPTNSGGMIAALDAWDGTVLWTFANPEPQNGDATKQALSQAPVTVAGGIVYYASMDAQGKLFLLDASTGAVLSSFATGASNACGPSVLNGGLFTGSGYLNFGLGSSGSKVSALGLSGSGWCPACLKGCENDGRCRTV
jgi:polyvinyl alcohol dehydrogenase (cytochrome)